MAVLSITTLLAAMASSYYLGIDNGTQGLTALLVDAESLNVVASGEGSYGCVPSLPEGCYEQEASHWITALQHAMQQVHAQVSQVQVLGIGISGQMHGEVLCDDDGTVLGPVRLWCDARNQAESDELTQLLDTKFAKRSTAARFLWTCRNRPELAAQVRHVTTPAGFLAWYLTGEWNLGVGDAAGMFPIVQQQQSNRFDYDSDKLERFDQLVGSASIQPLRKLLPNVRIAGQDAGSLTERGATLLGLTLSSSTEIPVAAAEGDQVASLAGSLIGRAGMVSCSFGTSVCANIVAGEGQTFEGVSPAVDHFCAADGKPIHMVWLRNGTTFLNTVVRSYNTNGDDAFSRVMPELIRAPADCGGLLALPFMDDEPGLDVKEGGSACIVGLNSDNGQPGNVAKAAILSTMFNLRLGCEVLDRQGFPRTELVLSGGLTKTPECAQILADVFDTPVTLLESAEEGCAWGAAVLAKYRHMKADGSMQQADWPTFLESIALEGTHGGRRRFESNEKEVNEYDKVFARYKSLVRLQPQLSSIVMSK